MAGDLIPPPSPAGRPAPDAPRFIELPPEPRPADEKTPRRSRPTGPPPYRSRFGFMMGALAGVLVAALAVTAIVVTTGDGTGAGLAKNWSTWKPTTTDANPGAQEIAQHVQQEYHLADGKQLVLVSGGPLEVQGIPLGVALRPPNGSIQVLDGHAVMYTLNGLGPLGSISSSPSTKQQHLLLRREALELALYSFRYLKDVDMVVALLPPKKPSSNASNTSPAVVTKKQAVFYRPGDLAPQLQVPLRFTLRPPVPKPQALVGEEARRIDSLTQSNLFLYDFSQGQNAKAYIVLHRP